jgi:hypothetical protein
MPIWHDAADEVYEIARTEDLTVDQKLKVAEIKALLSIGQELSLIQDSGINPDWSQRTT